MRRERGYVLGQEHAGREREPPVMALLLERRKPLSLDAPLLIRGGEYAPASPHAERFAPELHLVGRGPSRVGHGDPFEGLVQRAQMARGELGDDEGLHTPPSGTPSSAIRSSSTLSRSTMSLLRSPSWTEGNSAHSGRSVHGC